MKAILAKMDVNGYDVPQGHLAAIAIVVTAVLVPIWGTVCAHRTVSCLYVLAAIFLGVRFSIWKQYRVYRKSGDCTQAEHLRESAKFSIWAAILFAIAATYCLFRLHW